MSKIAVRLGDAEIDYIACLTSAPASYDGFGTFTLQEFAQHPFEDDKRPHRLVLIRAEHLEWQQGKNSSGLFATTEADWIESSILRDELYRRITGTAASSQERAASTDQTERQGSAAPADPGYAVLFPRYQIEPHMHHTGAAWIACDLNVVGAYVSGDQEYLRGFIHRESTDQFRRAVGGVYQVVQHAHAEELRDFESGKYFSETGESRVWSRYSENPEAYQVRHRPELLPLAQQLNAVAQFQSQTSVIERSSELVAVVRSNPELREALAGLIRRAAEVAKLEPRQTSEQFVYEEMGLRFWFDHPNQVLKFSRARPSEFAPSKPGDSPAMTLDEVYSEAGNDYFTAAQLTHILGQARQIMPPAAFATLKARALQGDECWMERSTRRDGLIARKLSERVANTKADAQRFLEPGKRATRASARTR